MDVYRPMDSKEKIPAMLSWSSYGKKYSVLDMPPMTIWHSCVKRSDLSGLEKFEGLDPAAWCPKGYAIISVDARGAGNNGGHIGVMGGWFSMHNFDLITKGVFRGNPASGVEDFAEMYRRSPTMNGFWKDKRVDFTNIRCPTYIRGSDVNGLHSMGSIRAWMEIPHEQSG
ncbi:hypothetical protein LTR86_002362 [Recurvomyces mirabilis]|nr:hypothetical protein LTR86_002362 [Recurvomyces mirabilis]